jgi:hypothetical protein
LLVSGQDDLGIQVVVLLQQGQQAAAVDELDWF